MTNYTQTQLRFLETFGCDLGDKTSELFVIRPDEKTHRPAPFATTREGIKKFFEGKQKSHVVIGAGTHSRWVSTLVEQLGHVVTVANPRKVQLISKSNQKDDQVDAQLLAK